MTDNLDTTGFLFRQPNGIPCTLYLPRDAKPLGTILFLHGRGECGTNSTRQLTTGLPRWLMLEPERWPFAVVIPQKPDFDAPWTDYQSQVFEHLDACIAEAKLDPDRTVITGLSQGGHGTFHIAASHPERFRGAAPVCGFASWNFRESPRDAETVARLAEPLAQMPMRIYHGEADDVVPAEESAAIHAALRERGSSALLETYPGVNHNSWDKAYGESDLAEWFAELLAR
jgi:predicted peptidase